jgi:hypothetical protein
MRNYSALFSTTVTSKLSEQLFFFEEKWLELCPAVK